MFITLIGTKTPKGMQNPLYGRMKLQNKKGVFFCVFQRVRCQNVQYHGIHPKSEYKRILQKTCLWNFFKLVMYKNAKIHARDPVRGNERTLRKNARVELYMEKEKNSTKNVYFECFSLC